MTSLARLVVERSEAGLDVADDFKRIPRYQFKIWFGELSEACPSRLCLDVERRPANALNVEIGAPMPRCRQLSPDGRGSTWLLSGGSPLAYGKCTLRDCPRTKKEPANG